MSNIKGLGTDIIEIKRIKKAIKRHGKPILDRLFTSGEQEYCNRHKKAYQHYAVRFAAKEAVVKALGVKLGQRIEWKDIEVLKEENGKPIIKFSIEVEKQFNHPKILISLSHSNDYATAVAIWSE